MQEDKICGELYKHIIQSLDIIEEPVNVQVINIQQANEDETDDVARLCVIEPNPTLHIDGYDYFRVKRIILNDTGNHTNNFDAALKELGVNIFCNFDYDISRQEYRIYYKSSLITMHSCPPLIHGIVDDITSDHWYNKKTEADIKFTIFIKRLYKMFYQFQYLMQFRGL